MGDESKTMSKRPVSVPPSADGIEEMMFVKGAEEAINLACRAVDAFVKNTKLPRDQRAFVFDIDDTIVFDNRKHGLPHPLGKEQAAKLESNIRKLYNHCKKFGLVFLVTARPFFPENVTWTHGQLHKAGIHGWHRCIFCPQSMRDSFKKISEFKRMARRQIERENDVKVVLSVGDRFADIVDHAQMDTATHPLRKDNKGFFVMTVSDAKHGGAIGLKLPCR